MNREQIKQKGKLLEEQMNRMFKLMEDDTKAEIDETSLSRVWSYTEKYEIATITAFRNQNVNCLKVRDGEEEGQEFSRKDNVERNKDLYAVLLNKGYGITKVKGTYIENFDTPAAVEVAEDVFFVVNYNQDENFFSTIIKLGKYFCQDSVLLKPIGEEAFLYGTNNSDFPGLDNKFPLGNFKGGQEAEFMTRVGKGKRPFQFAESYNVNSRHIISQRAKRIINDL